MIVIVTFATQLKTIQAINLNPKSISSLFTWVDFIYIYIYNFIYIYIYSSSRLGKLTRILGSKPARGSEPKLICLASSVRSKTRMEKDGSRPMISSRLKLRVDYPSVVRKASAKPSIESSYGLSRRWLFAPIKPMSLAATFVGIVFLSAPKWMCVGYAKQAFSCL